MAIFDGHVRGSAAFPALERICLAANLLNEPGRSSTRFATQFMTSYDRAGSPERVWFEMATGSSRVWISLDPGETKLSPPEGAARIVEIPAGSPKPTWEEIVTSSIESCRTLGPADPYERALLERGQRYRERVKAFATAGFSQAIARIRQASTERDLEQACTDLDAQFVEESPCSVVDYAAVTILMRLQARTGYWMEQDWTQSPARYARSYLNHILTDPGLRVASIKAVRAVSLEARKLARAAVLEALGGSFGRMSAPLRSAARLHFAAFLMIAALKDFAGLPRSDLPISPIVAEEGWACTQTGVVMGAEFCLEAPADEARRLLRKGRGDPDRIQDLVMATANEIEPRFPRFFARILFAQALTLAPRLERIQRGIELLEQMRDEPLGKETFETEWIDHALLSAYRQIEDASASTQIAAKIDGRLAQRAMLSQRG